MIKEFFTKYEWAFFILALALVLTFVPMLISAKSTFLVFLGLAYVIAFGFWGINLICRQVN